MQILHRANETHEWWREAVIYQIYPRSFASSGGPIGDLGGITSRLGYIKQLGADAIWLSPFYRSPQKDAGYDVADYRSVDPMFGDNHAAEAMIEKAHLLDLKVIVDLVPNHTSDQHAWFQAALAGGKDAPERAHYWFRDGKGEGGNEPPNDWLSVFGGPAWTRVKDRADAPGSPWENDDSWYLHLFDSSQPDLNWTDPAVHEEFNSILRYWLDRGADGFRVDVAHGLAKDPELPDWQYHWDMVSGGSEVPENVPAPPQWNRPEVHEIYREWRGVLNDYGQPALVAEAWLGDPKDMKLYVRRDEMSQAFNFDFLISPFEEAAYRKVIAESLAEMDAVGAPTTWVLSNHDVVRAASRFGLSTMGKGPNGIRAWEEQPDAALGARRALAAHALQAALPGSLYIYQGEELSLPEHTSLPDEVRQDPTFFRTNGAEAGRDGCRVPLPWLAEHPSFGFSPDGSSWLPQPHEWTELAMDRQALDPNSSLNFFKKMYQLRKVVGLGSAELLEADGPGLHYVSRAQGRDPLHIVTAFDEPVELPAGARVVLASSEVTQAGGEKAEGYVPANSTVWYVVDRQGL
ncbi:alpha-glucosidase [Arcanobacterium wilhelmae]|uniref:Alpha-glucosidase n=1 Tax=Arcanobacterium wilhelmae TaxID=1803177 RepID=A0ABT9NAF1_9ACTO|nr:glycoside hydrolase family 13 protein [Arcanobacterium wilhelmae]MDP9800493.1 alpha-glucosidase [Arcanobacterium wilhelmae]WFN89912.1 glycoside hydrolase family 13 protein [Arcanobacterium wilhelmae]